MSVNVIDALESSELLGALDTFRNLTPWRSWLAFLRAVYGVPMAQADRDLFARCTNRSASPPSTGYREAAAVVGRQAGKTRVGSAMVAFEAATHPAVRDGPMWALLLAQDHRAAVRTAFAYLCALFDASPALASMVTDRTADTLTLENGVTVAAYPCRPAAIRGLRACIAVCDELAFYRSGDGYAQDAEMLRSLRPTLATTGGRLIILSSPYGQSGALWELHRRHFGRDDSPVLVWQSGATMMHPDLPRDYLERMRESDPEGARAEIDGEFRAGLTALLDADAIARCVATDRLELPPAPGVSYLAFVDPSGGRSDAFTCAIGHRDGERVVVDVVRAWQAPFNPTGVTAECADLLRSYRVQRVTGDRFAGEWPREAYRAHGLTYDVAPKAKSDYYLALAAHVNGGRLELPDDARLLRELRLLERHRAPSGRDRVDAPRGEHEDRANAVAGLADELLQRQRGLTWGDLYDYGGAYYDERGNRREETREVMVKL